MRWVSGQTNLVYANVLPDTLIAYGDLVAQVEDDILPADQFTCPEEFKRYFLGIALRASMLGESTPISVATMGVFELECVPMVARLGQMVTPLVSDGDLKCLFAGVVCIAGHPSIAIGRVAQRYPSETRACCVEIKSTIMYGGV